MGSKCETCAHEYDSMYSPHCAPCRAREGSPKWESKSDYVRVVRCKDCKFFENGEINWCKFHSRFDDDGSWFEPEEDDYCSLGERRDENG